MYGIRFRLKQQPPLVDCRFIWKCPCDRSNDGTSNSCAGCSRKMLICWPCPKCTVFNPNSNAICSVCSEARPAAKLTAAGDDKDSAPWTCECECVGVQRMCRGFPRITFFIFSAFSTFSLDRHYNPAACTFTNEAGTDKCRMCDGLKPIAVMSRVVSVDSAPSLPSRSPRSASPTGSRTSAGTVCVYLWMIYLRVKLYHRCCNPWCICLPVTALGSLVAS